MTNPNTTQKYFGEKASQYGTTADVIEYAKSITSGLGKTRLQAIEYVSDHRYRTKRENRQKTVEFLAEVNKFLTKFTDEELVKILENPKAHVPIRKLIKDIIEKAKADPDPDHLDNYVAGIMNVYSKRLTRIIESMF